MGARKFKVDENLPAEVAVVLRVAGHDAMTVREQAMSGHPDAAVADVSRAEGRIPITLDLDFADIRSYPPVNSVGIVVLRPATQDKPRVLALLARLLPQLTVDPIDKTLWIVDEGGTRVRD